MDLNDLINFVCESKKLGYVNENSKWTRLVGGERIFRREKSPLVYVDSYLITCDSKVFTGKETVWIKNQIIWEMVYSGRIIEEDQNLDSEEVYAFLRRALRKIPPEMPLRGPKRFVEGNLTYLNLVKGDFENFSGKEKIKSEKNIIYRLKYHGSKLK